MLDKTELGFEEEMNNMVAEAISNVMHGSTSLSGSVGPTGPMGMKGEKGDTGSWATTAPTTLTLQDGDKSYELTPDILKRLIEMVKAEYPEDNL